MRRALLIALSLLAGLAARADVEVEETASADVTYTCRPAGGSGPWAMKDTDGALLGVEPGKTNFELHPKIQTALVCGAKVREPEAEIQIYPSIEVRRSRKGVTPNFERLPEGGFKFWLSLPGKKRGCDIVCVKG